MELSLFLGRLFGFYLIAVGLSCLVQREGASSLVKMVMKEPGFLYFSGAVNILIGLALVISHNVWVAAWPVVITVIGYLSLFKGLAYLLIPFESHKKYLKFFSNDTRLMWLGMLVLAVGIYLVYSVAGVRLPVKA